MFADAGIGAVATWEAVAVACCLGLICALLVAYAITYPLSYVHAYIEGLLAMAVRLVFRTALAVFFFVVWWSSAYFLSSIWLPGVASMMKNQLMSTVVYGTKTGLGFVGGLAEMMLTSVWEQYWT